MRYSKYHARKVKTEEGTFDSKREYARWVQLKDLEAQGIIFDLTRQVSFELLPSQLNEQGKTIERAVNYIADFVYTKDHKIVVEDAKGMKTDVYILKRKLMLYMKGIRVIEV